MRRVPQASHASMWPPSAAVRHRVRARSTTACAAETPCVRW